MTTLSRTSGKRRYVKPAIVAGGLTVAACFALAFNFSAGFAEPELIETAEAAEQVAIPVADAR